MKIKTITCHNVYNFGASLQAYALLTYLKNLGHDVEIIDYMPKYLSYNLWHISPKWNKNILLRLAFFAYVIPKRISQKKEREKFDKFTDEFLYLSKNRYSSIEELKEKVPLADIYFAGSDQIWNTYSQNGKDPSFYLDFAPSHSIKASYAASLSTSVINPDYEEQVKTWLSKLDYITVREKTGVKILNELGFNDVKVVLDPVFLLGKDKWSKIAEPTLFKEKYLLVYDQENNRSIKKNAIRLAKKYNLKIVAIESLYPMLYAHKRIRNTGPRDFLSLILNCDLCLTNSFHCIAFSIIFNKEFLLFPRTHQKVNSRMFDLLSSINLQNRIIETNFMYDYSEEINYSEVNEIINSNIIFSKNIINEIILIKNDKIQNYSSNKLSS